MQKLLNRLKNAGANLLLVLIGRDSTRQNADFCFLERLVSLRALGAEKSRAVTVAERAFEFDRKAWAATNAMFDKRLFFQGLAVGCRRRRGPLKTCQGCVNSWRILRYNFVGYRFGLLKIVTSLTLDVRRGRSIVSMLQFCYWSDRAT